MGTSSSVRAAPGWPVIGESDFTLIDTHTHYPWLLTGRGERAEQILCGGKTTGNASVPPVELSNLGDGST